jgi:SAM-dependent methyltransferase
MHLEPRDLVLNVLAACAPVRDSLRRLRDRRLHPDYPKLVDVALASLEARRRLFGDERLLGANILEIGSGLSVCLALLFVASGARRVVNVEIDRFGFIDDTRLYRLLVDRAARAGVPISWPPAGLLEAPEGGRIRLDPSRVALYLGRSATSIPEPDASIDLALSLAVLEHVRPQDMAPVAREMFRLMRPGAIGCHRIDLVDHYTRNTEPFRFLRFSETEYRWMYANRGSSSNRFRIDDFERIFRAAGFREVRFDEVHYFDDGPRFADWEKAFHPDFRGRPRDVMLALDCLMTVAR